MTLFLFLRPTYARRGADKEDPPPKLTRRTRKLLRRVIPKAESFTVDEIRKYLEDQEQKALELHEILREHHLRREEEELILLGII